MSLRESFKPRRNARRDVRLSRCPAPDQSVVAFEDRGEAPLRPPQRGQTLGEAVRGHAPNNFINAAPAPNREAPAVIPPTAICQGAKTMSRDSLPRSAISLMLLGDELAGLFLHRLAAGTAER